MNELVVVIFASGPNGLLSNAKEIVSSIDKNIGIDSYKYYVYVNNKDMESSYKDAIQQGKLHKILISSDSYAVQYNRFYNECKDIYRYLIYSHDDVVVDTSDFFSKTMSVIEGRNRVGWVTYTSSQYTTSGHLISNTSRSGFHRDRHQYPCIFECHTRDLKNLDYPKGPVQIFGPFSHFNLVSMKAMKEIGPCIDWSPTPLLTDEDWALESSRKGLVNIWIPNISYKHPRPGRGPQKKDSLRCHVQVHARFAQKWGCQCKYSDADIKMLVSKYPELKKFTGYTYEYMYLD